MSQQAIRTDCIAALPFWISLVYVPILAFAGWQGGAWLWLTPIYGWWATSLIDFVAGLRTDNPETETHDEDLKWYTAITLIWSFVQFLLMLGALYYAANTACLTTGQAWLFMGTVGIASGTIGINYAHELMHQKSKFERFLDDDGVVRPFQK